MYFAKFFTHAVPNYWNNYETYKIEACGDRAVVVMDGRESMPKMVESMEDWARKHNFSAFQLRKGETINRGVKNITDIQDVSTLCNYERG